MFTTAFVTYKWLEINYNNIKILKPFSVTFSELNTSKVFSDKSMVLAGIFNVTIAKLASFLDALERFNCARNFSKMFSHKFGVYLL